MHLRVESFHESPWLSAAGPQPFLQADLPTAGRLNQTLCSLKTSRKDGTQCTSDWRARPYPSAASTPGYMQTIGEGPRKSKLLCRTLLTGKSVIAHGFTRSPRMARPRALPLPSSQTAFGASMCRAMVLLHNPSYMDFSPTTKACSIGAG